MRSAASNARTDSSRCDRYAPTVLTGGRALVAPSSTKIACRDRYGVAPGRCSKFSSSTVAPTAGSRRPTRHGKPGEASTRTRTSFELAGKRLSADVVNLGGSSSSTSKGESLRDTVATLDAMHADVIVVRHSMSGAAQYLSERTRAAVVNGRGNGALRKIGAVQEGVLRRSFLRFGQYHDQVLWSMLAEEWHRKRSLHSLRIH